MRRFSAFLGSTAFFLALLCLTPADAATTVVAPGETLTLKEDLVLAGADVLEINGAAEKPSRLVGAAHQVRSGDAWTGHVKITYCILQGLGTEKTDALALAVGGDGDITVTDSTFDASGSVHVTTRDKSTVTFRRNTVLENALFPVEKQPGDSRACFVADGSGAGRKLFQGNQIYKSLLTFQAPNWTIGGDTDADGNIVVGLRAGIFAKGDDIVIRRNYVHVLLPVNEKYPYWSQVATIGPCGDTQQNVIRDGHWIVRGMSGEFHHNVVLEVHGHNFVQIGAGKMHHNIFAHKSAFPDRLGDTRVIGGSSAVHQPYTTDAIETYSNVFDGTSALTTAIEMNEKTLMPSLRNNVFYGFSVGARPSAYPKEPANANRDRLGYADYNLWFNPDGPCDNYQLTVAGKTERKDDGFAKHDVRTGGPVDEQVDPKFKGPLPKAFPFSEEDVKARKVTVSQILEFYRQAYSPAPGSPLLGAGDPADGAGTDIGAVQVSPLAPAPKK